MCLFFFAFSTILGWNLFGKINVAYLFGKKSVIVYTILALIFNIHGTMMANDLVWELSDMFNNLMVIPNVIALFALTNLVVKHADDPSRIPGKKRSFPSSVKIVKSAPDSFGGAFPVFTSIKQAAESFDAAALFLFAFLCFQQLPEREAQSPRHELPRARTIRGHFLR